MTLWQESTNILPAPGTTVWVRRFPGIEHPKQATFSADDAAAPLFTLIVNAPDTGHPVSMIIPANQIHSWRPITGGGPGPGICQPQSGAGTPIGVVIPAYVGQLYHDTDADSYYRGTGVTTADWSLLGGSAPPPYSDCTMLSAAGEPTGVTTPNFVGQLYHDTTADTFYRSTGLTSADWTLIASGTTGGLSWGPDQTQIGKLDLANDNNTQQFSAAALVTVGSDLILSNSPALTTATFPSLQTVGNDLALEGCHSLTAINFAALISTGANVNLAYCTALTTVSLPALTSTGVALLLFNCDVLANLSLPSLTSVGQQFDCNTSPQITALDLPSLTSVGTYFATVGCTALTTISAPQLTTIGTNCFAQSCPALSTVDLSAWLPTDGNYINFSADALDIPSVELILARCVAAGVTTSIINLSGGTNAGLSTLSPTAQANAAALGGQLAINP